MAGLLTCFILHAHMDPFNISRPNTVTTSHDFSKHMLNYVRDVQQQYTVISGREWHKGTQLIPERVVAMNKFAPNHVI